MVANNIVFIAAAIIAVAISGCSARGLHAAAAAGEAGGGCDGMAMLGFLTRFTVKGHLYARGNRSMCVSAGAACDRSGSIDCRPDADI